MTHGSPNSLCPKLPLFIDFSIMVDEDAGSPLVSLFCSLVSVASYYISGSHCPQSFPSVVLIFIPLQVGFWGINKNFPMWVFKKWRLGYLPFSLCFWPPYQCEAWGQDETVQELAPCRSPSSSLWMSEHYGIVAPTEYRLSEACEDTQETPQIFVGWILLSNWGDFTIRWTGSPLEYVNTFPDQETWLLPSLRMLTSLPSV